MDVLLYDDILRLCDSGKEAFLLWIYEAGLIKDYEGKCTRCEVGHLNMKDAEGDAKSIYWRCSNLVCRRRIRVTKDSFFEGSHIDMGNLLKMTYFWSWGLPNKYAGKELKIANGTIIKWFKVCREICGKALEKELEQIGGDGIEVVIDDSKFGRQRDRKGTKKVPGTWVFGGIEKNNKDKLFIIPVKDRSKNTLIPLIKKYIAPGSIIISDTCKAYCDIDELGLNYKHVTVNHSVEFVNVEAGGRTNHIESLWSTAKHVSNRYRENELQSYLDETVFRRKFMKDGEDPFMNFIKHGINVVYR